MVDLTHLITPTLLDKVKVALEPEHTSGVLTLTVPTTAVGSTPNLTATEYKTLVQVPLVNLTLYHAVSVTLVKSNELAALVAAVGAITLPKSDQFVSVAKGAVALDVTLRCHWIEPTEATPNIKVLLPPEHKFGVLPVMVLTTGSGSIVNGAVSEVNCEQLLLLINTLY